MIEIDFIGYSAIHPTDFEYEVASGFPSYLLLLITSPAELILENEPVPVQPNTAILYTPGHKIHYRAVKENYRNDWIRFCCNHSFVEQFPLKNTPFSVSDPEYCHNLIKLMTWESSLSSQDSETNILHLMRVLFSKLRECTMNDTTSIHTHALISLHKEIYNNPQFPWSVDKMAEKLSLSTSRVQTLYRKLFGSSCMDDVIEGRLRHAQDLLIYTEKPIHEIAEDCGYNNVEHFCRQFKLRNNCTPGQYRKNNPPPNIKKPPAHYTLGGSEFTESVNKTAEVLC